MNNLFLKFFSIVKFIMSPKNSYQAIPDNAIYDVHLFS